MNRLRYVFLLWLATTAVARAALIDGLVSYWPLDDSTGALTPDLSFGNNMNVIGSPVVATGQFSNAFTFNGSSTYCTNFHSPDNGVNGLPISRAGRYTVAMWVKGAAQTAKYLYTEGNSGTANTLFILQTGNAAANNSKFDVIIRTDGNSAVLNHIVSTTVVFDNNWHHVAFVDDRGSAKLYVDGNLDAANYNYTPSGTITPDISALGTLVRSNSGATFATVQPAIAVGNIFSGQIDEVATWERALSQTEVNQVRTNGIYIPGAAIPARPMTFTAQPANVTKTLGDWALFSVAGYGNRPFTYQWFKNGSAIANATGRTYQAVGLTTNNSGDFYAAAVTNSAGVSITTNGTITVLDDPAPDVGSGLVNYWPLDFIDQAGPDLFTKDYYSGNDMVLKNFLDTNDFVSGRYSNALAFDFVSKYGLRNSGSPIFNSTNYSVALWVMADFTGQNDRRVFSEGSSLANNPLFTLGTDNANPPTTASATVFVRNDAGVGAELVGKKSTRAVFDNTWHHLVWTDANGKGKLYVDGVLDETDYNYTRGALTLNMTVIGAVARAPLPVNYYFGNIDEVVTWKRVLSWTEIQSVMTNGIPPLSGPIPAGISIQPQNKTNYNADTVSFSVVASGTQPLSYQWLKNTNNIISQASNPSAVTDTLLLTNVQVADSNTFYSVVVTNAGGAITSSIARLLVLPFSPATNGEVLKVDFGLTGTNNAQPGFSEMTLAVNPGTFSNAVGVTISGIGAPLADRNRIAAPLVNNNPPNMTQAQIYNDFIFANNAGTDATGLRVLIDRLAPNTRFGVTIWSFDPQSAGTRFADWSETFSGTPIPITNSWVIGGNSITITNDFTYIFDGSIQPTNDYGQTLGALLTSSASGKLQIDALRHGGTSFGAFINAIRLVANPTATRITKAELVNGGSTLRVTVQGEYPGQPIFLQQNPVLVGGTWTDVSGATVAESRGPIMIFEIPVGPDQLFFRSASYLP